MVAGSAKPMKDTTRTGGLAGARLLLGLAAAALAFAPRVPAQPAVSNEYKVKAAFLFNFVQFVEWPRGAFANSDTPICIGVLGEDP